MGCAGSLSGRTEAAVLDLAEAVMLGGREGEVFDALVIEGGNKGRITAQLAKLPVVVRVNGNNGLLDEPKFGERLRLRLDRIDLAGRKAQFTPVNRLQSLRA